MMSSWEAGFKERARLGRFQPAYVLPKTTSSTNIPVRGPTTFRSAPFPHLKCRNSSPSGGKTAQQEATMLGTAPLRREHVLPDKNVHFQVSHWVKGRL